MNIGYAVSDDKNSRFLKPDGFSGNINVVDDMDWTLSPKFARRDAPRAYITEYQQTMGSLVASIITLGRFIKNTVSGGNNAGLNNIINATDNTDDIYKYKYLAEPTGFSYIFPYFSQQKSNRQTSFGYEDGQTPFSPLLNIASSQAGFGKGGLLGNLGKIQSLLSTAAGIVNASLPGKLSLEHPRSWSDTAVSEYTITFDLFNSVNETAITNNRNLAYILNYQQSPNRRNAVITDPVCIYDLYIPDVVHFPACYMSNLDIKNLGNTRMMKINGIERIIPEAYRFTMTFQSLLLPSRNIENGMDTGKKVQAITNSGDITEILDYLYSGDNNTNGALTNLNLSDEDSRRFLTSSRGILMDTMGVEGPPEPLR